MSTRKWDVRILCCPASTYWTRPHPETQKSLDRARADGYDVDIVDVTTEPGGYWRAIKERWTGDFDLVIVEHDNWFTPTQLASFDYCGYPWCNFGYYHMPDSDREDEVLTECIGFVRFRKELIRKVPADQIPTREDGGLDWYYVDRRLWHTCRRFGFRHCVHGGLVGHGHD